jgi:tetratricopeptide (TPR) repeat protein
MPQKPIFLLLAFLLAGSQILFGQQSLVDSLERELTSVGEDSNRFAIIYELYSALSFNDPARAEKYIYEALDLALTMERPRDQVLCYDKLGGIAMVRSDFDQAMSYYRQADQLLQSMDWPREEAIILGNMAAIHKEIGQYDSTLILNERFLEVARDLENPVFIGFGLDLKGQVYHNRGQFDLATQQHLLALRRYELVGDSSRMADAMRTAGEAMTAAMHLEDAETYLNRSKGIYERINDQYYLSQTYRDLGYVYFLRENYEQAREAYQKSLDISESLDDPFGKAQSLGNLGDWADSTGQLNLAVDYYQKALVLFEQIDDRFSGASVQQHLASIAFRQKNIREALALLDSSQSTFQGIQAYSMMKDGYKLYAKIYEELGRSTDALTAYRQYSVIRDSLNTVAKTRQLEEAKLMYEVEKKDQEIAFLNQGILLEKLEQRQLTIALIALGAMAALIIYALWWRRRKERLLAHECDRRQKAELAASRLEQEKLERELAAQVLQLCRKNEVLSNVHQEMERLRSGKNAGNGADLRRIQRTIQSDIQSDEDWKQFLSTFEQVHPRYLGALNEQYGPLTATEQRFACLLRMNLSSKEIATLLNISDAGVKKARYRLRKKLELPGDIPLQSFLAGIDKPKAV